MNIDLITKDQKAINLIEELVEVSCSYGRIFADLQIQLYKSDDYPEMVHKYLEAETSKEALGAFIERVQEVTK